MALDLLEKFNTLLNAAVNAKLPQRERRSALDKLEQEQLAAIRRALGEVELRERNLVKHLNKAPFRPQPKAATFSTSAPTKNGPPSWNITSEISRLQAIDLEENWRRWKKNWPWPRKPWKKRNVRPAAAMKPPVKCWACPPPAPNRLPLLHRTPP